MRNVNKYLLPVFLLLQICLAAQADSLKLKHGRHYRFTLNDGSEHKGFVVEESADYLTIESRPDLKRTEIRKSTIVKVEVVSTSESLREDVLGTNPHPENYMLFSPALPFEPQQLSSTGHWLILENIQYAFNENWAINATALTFYPCAIGVKNTFKVNRNTYVGASANAFAWLGGNDGSSNLLGFLLQAKLTQGNSNRNFTAGAGLIGLNSALFGLNLSGNTFIQTPILSMGFCNRFASRWSLVLDGHMLPEEMLMIGGAGLKFLNDEKRCWSFGFYSFLRDPQSQILAGNRSFSLPLPYLSYARKFD